MINQTDPLTHALVSVIMSAADNLSKQQKLQAYRSGTSISVDLNGAPVTVVPLSPELHL